MAGARIGPISGVNWAAYGNVASLIMQAAEASARGSAALGAGIGGGLQSLGHGIQRGRERREARAERQQDRTDRNAHWRAELDYRKDRDLKDDARADRRLAMDSANIAEDNERIRTQGEIELLNRLIETSAKKATLADQAGNVPGLQAALAEIETLSAAQQGRVAKMLKINALPGTQPTAAQPANVGPVDWEGLFADASQSTRGRGYMRQTPSAGTLRDAELAHPGVIVQHGAPEPAASGAIERRGETPSMARRRLEEAAVEREGMRLSGDQSGYRKALMPNGLPDDPMEVARTVVSQTANPAAKRAELMVAMLDTKIAALEQGKQSIGNKTPQDLIARRAHDRAQSILTNTKLPFMAVVDIGKQRGMALNEAAKKADEAKKKAAEADADNKDLDLRVKGAFAAFRAKFGRDPTPEEAPLVLDQVRAKITPDAAVENFPKPDKPQDAKKDERLKALEDEAELVRKTLSQNSKPKLVPGSGGKEVYNLGDRTNLGPFSTESLIMAQRHTDNEQTKAFYEKEIASRKNAKEARLRVDSLTSSTLSDEEYVRQEAARRKVDPERLTDDQLREILNARGR